MKLTKVISTVKSAAVFRRSCFGDNTIIVDQHSAFKEPVFPGHIIDSGVGLARSRNIGISNVESDYILISDDDVSFLPGVDAAIEKAFLDNDADILTFMAITPSGTPFRNYKSKKFNHNYLTIFGVSSIEIAMRRSSIIKHKLKFDERFGLGSDFPTGEEIIFLADAHKHGLSILFLPAPIVIHPAESSGSALYGNHQLIQAKGAMFARMFGLRGLLFNLLFSIKHHGKSEFNAWNFFRLMNIGAFKFLRHYKNIS